jgi:putative transcriptional regulator
MRDTIINNVQTYRKNAELTQEELADKVGVTRQTIIAIEKGNYVPSVALALKIASSFNATVEELFLLAN